MNAPIGPNQCSVCGGEYGHKQTCTLICQVNLRDGLQWFAETMELTLRAHDHQKIGWSHLSAKWITKRIVDEAGEARRACETYRKSGSVLSRDRAIRECADVANFAMMLADNLRRDLLRPKKRKGM